MWWIFLIAGKCITKRASLEHAVQEKPSWGRQMKGREDGPMLRRLRKHTMAGRLAQKLVQRLRHGQVVTFRSQLRDLLSLDLGQLFHWEPQFITCDNNGTYLIRWLGGSDELSTTRKDLSRISLHMQ